MRFSLPKVMFSRRQEPLPVLTRWDRQALESPAPPGRTPYAVYAQMEQDAMVQTALTVKRLGVLAPETRIEHDGSAEGARRARFVEEAFAAMSGSPSRILEAAMDAFARGWAVLEPVYREEGGQV